MEARALRNLYERQLEIVFNLSDSHLLALCVR